MYIYIYIYTHIYIYIEREREILVRKPLPCSPAAETALQPLILCISS